MMQYSIAVAGCQVPWCGRSPGRGWRDRGCRERFGSGARHRVKVRDLRRLIVVAAGDGAGGADAENPVSVSPRNEQQLPLGGSSAATKQVTCR